MAKLKKYELLVEAKKVAGNQIFVVKASSEKDAIKRFRNGEGEVVRDELEVTELGDVQCLGLYQEEEKC